MRPFNITDKRVQAMIHILVWGAVFALPYFTDSSHNHPRPGHPGGLEPEFLKLNLANLALWMASFYLNAGLLIPKLFYRKKYWQYALSLLLTFAVVVSLHNVMFGLIVTAVSPDPVKSLRFIIPAFVLVIAVSIAYRMTVDKMRSDKLELEKKQENMKTELAFLRSQISPHFMLNVLNNIVALNRLKSDDLEPTLMKLSGLMQYMLYQTDEEKVSLTAEADYLRSYVDLQQQRFGSKVKVTLDISLADEWSELEPMLLIPFVENAFKHGTGMIADPGIDIALSTNHRNELSFRVRNKFNPASDDVKDKTSGIGLVNCQRRLNLLYGEKHKLEITRGNGIFEVNLKLTLHG